MSGHWKGWLRAAGVLVAAGVVAVLWSPGAAVGGTAPDDDGGSDHPLVLLEVLAQDLLSPVDALAKAQAEAGDALAFEIELEAVRHDGRTVVVWDVDFLAEGEGVLGIAIHARTGAVIARGTEKDDDESTGVRARIGGTAVDLAAVLAKLHEHVEGLVLAAELEAEDDEPAEWEADLVHAGRRLEIEVDPTSGKLVFEHGDDEDDDDEDEDDDRVDD